MKNDSLIFDWNQVGPVYPSIGGPVELNDETLRDGLQSPSVRDPSLDQKIRFVHLMDDLGIYTADIGLPGAGPRALESVDVLVREIVQSKLRLRPNCAGRTLRQDIVPIAALSQSHGVAIEAYLFLGSSPIRQYVEDWNLDRLLEISGGAIKFATEEGLPVAFVTEDTTRSDPGTLRALFLTAIENGARRLCLCDTVGHACPAGVSNLIRFAKDVIHETGLEIALDWHGHRDRSLALTNSLTAIAEGVRRIHGTALGVGERVGNTPMDLLLVNLRLFGAIDNDLSALNAYVQLAEEALGAPRPYNYPMFGDDAFRTATGVHAAAIIKARTRGDDWLADRVYSGVPAGWLGRHQDIEVGPMSGASNVKYWLKQHGFTSTPRTVDAVLRAAKDTDHVLSELEITHTLAKELLRNQEGSDAGA
ncbi:MAG TPA: 2-isopropylmalate synthase [Candidatus Eisenbacteria bacterium]|nr:2-isopropylmalate synthase [Candidatus Eisenbacteria bacterium]